MNDKYRYCRIRSCETKIGIEYIYFLNFKRIETLYDVWIYKHDRVVFLNEWLCIQIFFFIICRMNLSEFLHVPSLLSVSKSLYNLWSFTLNRKGKQSIFTSIPLQWLCLFNEHETPSKFLYYVYAYNTFKYTDKFKENKINYWWKNLFNCSWMSWFWCFPECLRVHVKTGEGCLFFQQISSLLTSIHIFMLGV